MAYTLNYNQLSEKIQQWQGLPFSLSGCEVMPLDYNAGKTGWILYSKSLTKTRLSQFQRELGLPMVIVSAWKVKQIQVVRIAGSMPPKARQIANKLQLDIASIEHLPSLQSPGLLVMDMDSTAITIECIDELARLHGCGEMVSQITEQAMRGELDYTTSLRKRVATLAGADQAILEQVKQALPLTPGLRFVVNQLKKHGWQIAIVSGGFSYFADHLKQKLKLYQAHANQLAISKGKLNGKVQGTIVDAGHKAKLLVQMAESLNIPLKQTVAIGDGANDLKMLKTAGLGVAYHAKPKVEDKAQIAIKYSDLVGLYCILSTSLNSEG